MPRVRVEDGNGDAATLHEYNGRIFPNGPFGDMDLILRALPDLRAREDDIVIVCFPKSGSHWVLEICTLLLSGKAEISNQKGAFIELMPQETLDQLPGRRRLTTHVRPDMLPKDFIARKSKLIFLARNPKDVFVSRFHMVKNLRHYDYNGTWDGFFGFMFNGKNCYGSWFEYMKSWDAFFKENVNIPVLKLCYEDLKKDLRTGVDQIAGFLGVERDEVFRQKVAEKCQFANMKKDKLIDERLKLLSTAQYHPMVRKGVVGNWKNYFTVAQNERFDREYRTQMEGFRYNFEQYM